MTNVSLISLPSEISPPLSNEITKFITGTPEGREGYGKFSQETKKIAVEFDQIHGMLPAAPPGFLFGGNTFGGRLRRGSGGGVPQPPENFPKFSKLFHKIIFRAFGRKRKKFGKFDKILKLFDKNSIEKFIF